MSRNQWSGPKIGEFCYGMVAIPSETSTHKHKTGDTPSPKIRPIYIEDIRNNGSLYIIHFCTNFGNNEIHTQFYDDPWKRDEYLPVGNTLQLNGHANLRTVPQCQKVPQYISLRRITVARIALATPRSNAVNYKLEIDEQIRLDTLSNAWLQRRRFGAVIPTIHPSSPSSAPTSSSRRRQAKSKRKNAHNSTQLGFSENTNNPGLSTTGSGAMSSNAKQTKQWIYKGEFDREDEHVPEELYEDFYWEGSITELLEPLSIRVPSIKFLPITNGKFITTNDLTPTDDFEIEVERYNAYQKIELDQSDQFSD
jgi:hypothetical protein